MKHRFIFLMCAIYFSLSTAFGQSAAPSLTGKNIFRQSQILFPSALNKSVTPSMLVPSSFYTANLAFFCRQEIKFEKATKIPFKFRLGSVQQTDYLEGKGRAY